MNKIVRLVFRFFFVVSFVYVFASHINIVWAAEMYPFQGILHADALVVHNAPNTLNTSAVTELAYGTRVKVTKLTGSVYEIIYDGDKVGYVSKNYVTNVDANTSTTNLAGVEDYSSYCKYLGTQGFPESYCPYLYYLHAKHPKWVFKADVIDKTLDEISKGEERKCSLQTTNKNYWLSTVPDEANYYWVNASVISSFMDPRNSLFEDKIFQFLDSDDTKDLVADNTLNYLVGTGPLKEHLLTFKNAASEHGINAVQLVSRSVQEGNNNKNGYLPSSGLYTTKTGTMYNGQTLDGFYNYYNIGATNANGLTAQARAVAYAAGYVGGISNGRPWTTPEKAIYGGADFLANYYIRKGQDTIYYQKFNVSSYRTGSMYTNQYMTNINAPQAEGTSVYKTYKASNDLDLAFIFTIPVYQGMGESYQPVDKSSNNYLRTITIDGKEVAFDKDVIELGDMNFVTSNATIKVEGKPESALATVTGSGDYTFTNGVVAIKFVVKAEDGSERTYTLNVKQVLPVENITVDSIVSKMAVKVSGQYMYGISIKESAASVISTVAKNNGTATIVDANGVSKSSGNLRTGDKITIKGTLDTKTYTLAIRGDIQGDGLIDLKDFVLIQSHILKKNVLSNERFYAGDVNYDGVINLSDFVLIQSHILGKSSL